jgi:hypothetical protein
VTAEVPARTRAGAARAALPWLVAAIGAATIVVGLVAHLRDGVVLGLPDPPFVGNLGLRAHPLLAVSLACFALAALAAPRLLSPRIATATFAAAITALSLVLRLALNAGREGTIGWDGMFRLDRFEGPNEYLPVLRSFRYGAGFFLDRFAELVPAEPVHVAGHGPALPLLMYWLHLDTPARLAAFCIAAGALAVPVAYATARLVLDSEAAARVAALLFALAPGALLFGVTSGDAVYLLVALLAAWGLSGRGWAARAAGALALAVAAAFSWSLLAVGAWAAIVRLRRDGARAALAQCVLCGAVLVAGFALLYAATGFDPIGTIRATGGVYRLGIAATRPYWFWFTGSPTAFLVVLGLPITWSALRALAAGRTTAIAVFAVIGVAMVLGLTKAETERIWLYLAPLVCFAAATQLTGRDRALRVVVALLCLQAVLWEACFNTVW